MNTVMLIGRIMFALMLVISGINHFKKAETMSGYSAFKKVPQPKLATFLAGVVLVASGLSVALGIYADLGAVVSAGLLVVIALMMHDFWKAADPQTKQNESIAFFKNISMAGGALFIFATAAIAESDIGWTLTDSLFKISR